MACKQEVFQIMLCYTASLQSRTWYNFAASQL